MDDIKILVADDHPGFREGLRRFLDDEDGLECVGLASDGEEAIRLMEELHPDVAIIDVAMPRLSGLEVAKRIKEMQPSIAIIMISAYDYESYVSASLRAGAAGYLLKNSSLRNIANAVCAVHAGEAVFDLKATGKILARLSAEKVGQAGKVETLSEREVEILKLTAKGLTNKGIGQQLNISPRTVQAHLVSIFGKLDASSRTEAVLHALTDGWLTLDDIKRESFHGE